jgi:hypothetical protein
MLGSGGIYDRKAQGVSQLDTRNEREKSKPTVSKHDKKSRRMDWIIRKVTEIKITPTTQGRLLSQQVTEASLRCLDGMETGSHEEQ